MHAPLELLAGVVAAAATTTPTASPPVPTSFPAPATPSPAPPLSAPSSVSAPTSSLPATLPPARHLIQSTPQTAVSAPRAPSPMLSAPIPHLPAPPSPPSDVTTSTAGARASAPTPITQTAKRAKARHGGGRQASQQNRRVLKRPFEAASPAPERNESSQQAMQPAWSSEKSASVGARNATSSGREEKPADDDSQDNKRAMRAERNRQSAAASRERKKRHIKDLEEKVKRLTEVNSSLLYQLDVQKQSWEEKEMCLQQEIARLRHQLNRESAFRASPPQNHPMTLHHLTHRGPVTY